MKKLKINLFNQATIQQAIKDIEDYKQEIIKGTERFCKELSDEGINIVNLNIPDEFASYVAFGRKIDPQQYGCDAIIILTDVIPYESRWLVKGENGKEIEKTAKLSAVLMAEFGSGVKADANAKHIKATNVKEKVGRGTFPSQTNEPFGNINHAQKQDIWWYKDAKTKEWQHSSGATPKMPIYNAYLEMERQIRQKAREIFKT